MLSQEVPASVHFWIVLLTGKEESEFVRTCLPSARNRGTRFELAMLYSNFEGRLANCMFNPVS